MSRGEPDFGENPKEELQAEVVAEKEIQAEMPKDFEDPEGLFIPNDQSDRDATFVDNKGKISNKKVPYFSTDNEFDNFYQFLTDGGYPSDSAWVHSIEIGLSTSRAMKKETAESIKNFMDEGLYFQKIKKDIFCETRNFWSWSAGFSTPIFVFSNRNEMLNKYIDAVSVNSTYSNEKRVDQLKSLRNGILFERDTE